MVFLILENDKNGIEVGINQFAAALILLFYLAT
jgi:hypothetical protein